MKSTRFQLAAIVALCALPVLAQRTGLSASRQNQLESHMSGWSGVKDRATKLSAAFLQGVSSNPQYSLASLKIAAHSAWQVSQSLERKEALRQTKSLSKLDADLAAGKLNRLDQAACVAAVNKTFQLRMLYVYGTLFPQSLNESVSGRDGKPIGGQLAGPLFQQEATAQERQSLGQIYSAQCPYEPSLFDEN